MKRCLTILTIATTGLLLSTGAATAVPLPDPPTHRAAVPATARLLSELADAYSSAAPEAKHRLHNEIVLVVDLGSAALT